MRSSEVAKGTPATSFPSASGRASVESWKAGEEMISRSETVALTRLGISIPTAALPGIGATIRMRCAFSASARSSWRFRIWLTFIPGAGSNSKSVITGPGCTSETFPSTSKSARVRSNTRESSSSSFSSIACRFDS